MNKIMISFILSMSILLSSQIDILLDACQKNNTAACEELGLLYNEGIGFEQNSSKAKIFFKKACEYGKDTACEKLK